MPELPEVETVRSEIDQILRHQCIEKVEVFEPRLRKKITSDFGEVLKNLTIARISRRAKYILISFEESDLTLVIHLGMSGRVSLHPSFQDRQKHDHVIFTFYNGFRMHFHDPRRFGALFLTDQPDDLFRHVGPEPLRVDFTGNVLFKRLKAKKTSIKTALLDQRVIAGLGNIYVCEALHQSCIHPLKPAGELDNLQCESLVKAIQEVLQRAITAGGSTLRDHKRTNGSAGAFQHQFNVYDQGGKICTQCQQGTIQRIKQNNRSTYFCNICQIL